MPFKQSYDDNFVPTVTVSPENGTYKRITAIKFVIISIRKDSNLFDTSSFDYHYQTIKTNIAPFSSKTIKLSTNLKPNYIITDVCIEMVRFSDGSIKTY